MKSIKNVRLLAVLLALLMLLSFSAACTQNGENGGAEEPAITTEGNNAPGGSTSGEESTEAPLPAIWDNATYKENKSFGEGAKTVEIEVIADDFSVTFTVKTDEEFLGAALLAHELVTGNMGDYGLYIESVNGMVADYSIDQTYWAISKGGEYLMTGADSTPIENGAHYELTRTKG